MGFGIGPSEKIQEKNGAGGRRGALRPPPPRAKEEKPRSRSFCLFLVV
jgi:hypothetical protein